MPTLTATKRAWYVPWLTQRLQAMDSSHVALSAVELRADGFEEYRCDRPMSIGVAITSLTKVLRSANNNDILNMRKGDNADSLHLVFEGTSTYRR